MANIVRFDPFEDMVRLQREVNRLFEDSSRSGSRNSSELAQAPTWAPAVDIIEDANEIVLKAELPGLKQEAIDIELTGETLTIRGERKFEDTQRRDSYVRMERSYGTFQRSFTHRRSRAGRRRRRLLQRRRPGSPSAEVGSHEAEEGPGHDQLSRCAKEAWDFALPRRGSVNLRETQARVHKSIPVRRAAPRGAALSVVGETSVSSREAIAHDLEGVSIVARFLCRQRDRQSRRIPCVTQRSRYAEKLHAGYLCRCARAQAGDRHGPAVVRPGHRERVQGAVLLGEPEVLRRVV